MLHPVIFRKEGSTLIFTLAVIAIIVVIYMIHKYHPDLMPRQQNLLVGAGVAVLALLVGFSRNDDLGQYRTKDSASDAPQIFRQIVQ